MYQNNSDTFWIRHTTIDLYAAAAPDSPHNHNQNEREEIYSKLFPTMETAEKANSNVMWEKYNHEYADRDE